MGKWIDLNRRFSAEEIFITSSVTFDKLAAATGISQSQLKRWAKEGDWKYHRFEYIKRFGERFLQKAEIRAKISG